MNEETVETVLWKGGPSQWTRTSTYVLCGLAAAALIAVAVMVPEIRMIALAAVAVPFLWALWTYLKVRFEIYELTGERLRFSTGVFNRHIDEIELYRIKDSTVRQPFWLRLFGLGNVILETSDRSHAVATLHAVNDPVAVREQVRNQVERLRDLKRVREVDFDGGEGGFEMR